MNDRISIDPRTMGGVACVAGTRIPVATIVALLGQNYEADDVIGEYVGHVLPGPWV